MAHTLRARFKRDIVAEFLPSRAALRGKREKKSKVIIFCSGLPGVPCQKPLLEFFAKKGYWVFSPRYRGTWESGGRLLKISPHRDILDVVDGLSKGFVSLWDGRRYRVKPEKIYLFAASFGGPAALLASEDRRVTKVVAFSPVVDWRSPIKNKIERIENFGRFLGKAYGNAYRFDSRDIRKLKKGNFYNPVTSLKNIEGKKIFIIHAKDDDVVDWKPVKNFADLTSSKLLIERSGGHFGLTNFIDPKFYPKIRNFLKK